MNFMNPTSLASYTNPYHYPTFLPHPPPHPQLGIILAVICFFFFKSVCRFKSVYCTVKQFFNIALTLLNGLISSFLYTIQRKHCLLSHKAFKNVQSYRMAFLIPTTFNVTLSSMGAHLWLSATCCHKYIRKLTLTMSSRSSQQ